jgi:SAM-dependent methyltransferase
LLSTWKKVNPSVFLNVVLAEWLQRRSELDEAASTQRAREARLPKKTLMAMLERLQGWIESFEFPDERSTWADYVSECNYVRAGTKFKQDEVREFVRTMKPRSVLDLGCNTGDFSVVALEGGVAEAIGLDSDLNSLNVACNRAESVAADFLPLYADLADPTASQGWANRERPALTERFRCEGVLALAVLHHLVIGRNVPLREVVRWISSLAPLGVMEWIPKSDPQVQRMLSAREDVFDDYGVEAFEEALRATAEIVRVSEVPGTERRLYWYRNAGGSTAA